MLGTRPSHIKMTLQPSSPGELEKPFLKSLLWRVGKQSLYNDIISHLAQMEKQKTSWKQRERAHNATVKRRFVGVMLVHVVTVLCVLYTLGAQAMELHRVSHTTATAVPNVHCLCSGIPNQTLCSWADPLDVTPLQYIVTCSERQKQHLNVTTPDSAHKMWHCHLPGLKLLTDYILNVTAVYPEGSSSHLSTFMIEDIVKPDPPVNLRVSSSDPKVVLVQWDPPSTWSYMDIFPLKYELLYQWWSGGQLWSNHLKPFRSTSAPLKGLTRGRTYQLQVCAKDALGLGHCSDWSVPVNVTLPLPHS
ncbi:hypothetical protein WMY93_017382 [Mugilogobius chulae]|uniref:Fibronectin type-III domain-containing protein n=1 Tax=Mugilogobius chulae TaxID=88201 RepID=A0AAW0NSV0_9GOBI